LDIRHKDDEIVSVPATTRQQVPSDEESWDPTGAMTYGRTAWSSGLEFSKAFSKVGIGSKVDSRSEWNGCPSERLAVSLFVGRFLVKFRAAADVARGTPVLTSVRPP